jgi:adenylate cyclase class 2
MAHLNIEIKAKTKNPISVRDYLKTNKAIFKGIDIQSDTYFNVINGRLKLREGNIENNLIFYERSDQPGAKESKFQLANVPDAKALKEVLISSLGVRVVVKKKREIFFIENVKFHIGEVEGLGSFIEIEASDLYADVSKTELQKQCEFYIKEFRITQEDMVSVSYSDMMLALTE